MTTETVQPKPASQAGRREISVEEQTLLTLKAINSKLNFFVIVLILSLIVQFFAGLIS